MEESLFQTDLFLLIILVILIILSAFFSGSETAFFALNKFKLIHLIRKKDKLALKVKKVLDDQSSLISTILIGNNLVNIAASSISTYLFIKYFGESGVIYSTIVMTIIILIFAEITPKVYSSNNPQKVSFFAVNILDKLILLFRPFIFFTNFFTKLLLKLFHGKQEESKFHITEEELKSIIVTGEEIGSIEKEKSSMLNNLLSFSNLLVKDVMIPRVDVITLNIDDSIDDILQIIYKENFSRYPVYKDSIDNIIGILHTKNLLKLLSNVKEIKNIDIIKILQKPYFVPEFAKVEELLKLMKKKNFHIAIVVDEYGGFNGIITLEDILEEIVGEIQDEFDKEEEKIIKISDKEYILDGDISIKKFNEIFQFNLPESPEISTLAGFLISQLDKIPEKEDKINFNNLEFTVVELDKMKIEKIKMVIKDEKF